MAKLKCDEHGRRIIAVDGVFIHRTGDGSKCSSPTAKIKDKTFFAKRPVRVTGPASTSIQRLNEEFLRFFNQRTFDKIDEALRGLGEAAQKMHEHFLENPIPIPIIQPPPVSPEAIENMKARLRGIRPTYQIVDEVKVFEYDGDYGPKPHYLPIKHHKHLNLPFPTPKIEEI